MRLALHDIAHSRAGDKGQLITLSLIAYESAWFPVLRDRVQSAQVRAHLLDRLVGEVTRYEMPKLAALMFVCGRAGTDTVTTSLHIDGHGKTLSSALLELEIDVPDEQAREVGLRSPWPATSADDRQ
jgi:hypothetical protein